MIFGAFHFLCRSMFSASYFWLMSFLKISSFSFVSESLLLFFQFWKVIFSQVSSCALTVSFFSILNLSIYFLLFFMNSKENTIVIILFFSSECSAIFLFLYWLLSIFSICLLCSRIWICNIEAWLCFGIYLGRYFLGISDPWFFIWQ